jgi:hypothetical protein
VARYSPSAAKKPAETHAKGHSLDDRIDT